MSLPLRCRSGSGSRVIAAESLGARHRPLRSQDGRGGGRGGHGGSPTQAICGGPPSTDGDEGAAWNLDDDEDPGREGPIIDIY